MSYPLDSLGPDSGESPARLIPKDILNHLLLIWVIQHYPHKPTRVTKDGQRADVLSCDIVDLDQVGDDGQPGLLARATWLRQSRLIQKLKDRVGKPNPVLVRLFRNMSTNGGIPPFDLLSMQDDPGCVQRYQAWMAAHPGFQPSQPYLDIPDSAGPSSQGPPPAWSQPTTQPAAGPPAAATRAAQETTLERLARQAQTPAPGFTWRGQSGNPSDPDVPQY